MKVRYTSILVMLMAVLVVSSCKKKEPEPPTYNPEADFQAIDVSTPGIQDVTIDLNSSEKWVFRVITPTVTGGDTRPLILALHGASGGNPDAHKSTACYVEPGLESLNAFIIHPNGGTELWTEYGNQQMLATLTQWAMKYWSVDANKIVVTGYSNGGNGAWFFGETQPHIFSAAIPMASSYNTLKPDSTARKMGIPMYVIHGEDDELFPLAETQAWVDATISAGSDITFVVAPGLGHYVPCDYVPYLKDAAQWLVDEVWQ